ncbi:MAG: TraR/DksA C4-type zinc finger protein [Bacillota bacterium]
MFTPEQLNGLRSQLLELRESLNRQVSEIEEGGLRKSLRESIQELSAYDNHPADLGTETFERSKDLALLDNAWIQLRKVGDALHNMDRGTYGSCSSCGQTISYERLEAVPETTLCLECRKEFEGEGDFLPRPIEEDVIVSIFQGEGDPDEIEYDAEDSWQDVARWGEHAVNSGSGSYYGGSNLGESRGAVEDVDSIPYERDEDGIIYKDYGVFDDEDQPESY